MQIRTARVADAEVIARGEAETARMPGLLVGRPGEIPLDAYRASLELMNNDPLADLVVLKVGQERYVVVAADRLDAAEHSWAVYDRGWEEQILFKP